MIPRYFIVLSLTLLTACTLSDTVVIPDKTNSGFLIGTGSIFTGTIHTGTIITGDIDHQAPLVEDISGSGDAYYPIFQGLETRAIPVNHRSGSGTYISFINSEAKAMHVTVTFPISVSGGNLRLTQILMPDGTMDGPYGTDNIIPLTQLGGYELRFSENQMAGEPWSGDALITIQLLAK